MEKDKKYSEAEIKKLIGMAHKSITSRKGKEYAPNSKEIQKWIDDHLEKKSEIKEKWSQKYKNSIDCNNPKGFSQKAHCQGKKKETKEQTMADSAGSFEPALSTAPIKKVNKIHNSDVTEMELDEITDASSSGAYDAPFGSGSKTPLKIGGVKSIKSSRAVKDKNFPKWGGPDAVFIKIKDKCKKYPYCNQGIDAIELLEDIEIKEAIDFASKKHGIPISEVKKVVLNEIKKIFI